MAGKKRKTKKGSLSRVRKRSLKKKAGRERTKHARLARRRVGSVSPSPRSPKEADESEILLRREKAFRKEAAEIIKKETSLEASSDRRKKSRDEDGEEDESEDDMDQTLDRTSMRIYLDQIEHIPLLAPEDEVSLGEKVKQGGHAGETARHRMIRSNLRLVIAIAKRYAHMGLPFSDLVEEGNIGLMRAVEKFDTTRGYRFSTYASWWIKQAIMRSLSNHAKTIRIPVYMYGIISNWRKVRDALTQRLNRTPTRREIAKVLLVPVAKVREIENMMNRPSSLNTPISLDGTTELIDVIEDDEAHKPDVQIAEVLKNERVQRLLEVLDEREKKILTLRFGLDDHDPHTLAEVAEEFGVTRERIRQIESLTLKKIRAQLTLEGDQFENYLPH